MMTESTTKGKSYRLELMIDEEGNNIRVVGGDSLPISQEATEPYYPGWFILERKMEPPVICVGLETLAVLFQGGDVNLNEAILIPDSNIRNAARYALNVCSPEIRDSQNSQDRREEIEEIAHLKRTTPRRTEYTLTPNRVEEMLAATIPGGSVSDPQEIADAIREWFGYSYDDLEETTDE